MREQDRLMFMKMAFLLNFFMPVTFGVQSNCDFQQSMVVGQQYFIYNAEYPNYYGPSTSCRWVAYSSLVNSKIVLSCEDVDLPASPNCEGDRLSISLTGSTSLADAHNYCGKGNMTLISTGNRIAIGLTSTYYSRGGRFLCTATAILTDATTTPRPNVCDCGWRRQTRIVGGVETGVNEFPSMAGLVDSLQRKVVCGATIISRSYAVTAAHCAYKKNPVNYGLLVGDHRLSTGNEAPATVLYAVQKFVVHQFYDPTNEVNDIAVVKTVLLITFSDQVGPICLPFKYSGTSFAAAQATVLGWGTTDFSDPTSDVLLEANLTIVTNAWCQSRLTSNTIIPSQICTYTPGKDACQFDSGGPLLWYDPNSRRDNLIGIISYGLGCATSYPGVNTRVANFLNWIVNNATEGTQQYCIK